VLPRGPISVTEWVGTVGRDFSLTIPGMALSSGDRVRLVNPDLECGTEQALHMHHDVVPRTSPNGPPDSGSTSKLESWSNTRVLKLGFYKVCWCSGTSDCAMGLDFNYVAGFVVVTGELRTLVGNGDNPPSGTSDNLALPTDMGSSKIGNKAAGMAVADEGATVFFSEPHRVCQVFLLGAVVQTVVGSLVGRLCPSCGDGSLGTSAYLMNPRGLVVCEGKLPLLIQGITEFAAMTELVASSRPWWGTVHAVTLVMVGTL